MAQLGYANSLTLAGALFPQPEDPGLCMLNLGQQESVVCWQGLTVFLWVPGMATATTLFPLLQGEEGHPTPSQVATSKYSSRARVAQGSLESWGVQDVPLGVEQNPNSFPPWPVLTPARAEAESCTPQTRLG